MRDLARAALLALNFTLLASPTLLALPYLVATALVALVDIILVTFWNELSPSPIRDEPAVHNRPAIRTPKSAIVSFLATITAAILLFLGCRAWLHQILIYPIDAHRADMLVVIQHGIRRLLQGQNPYTMYHVPWEATLPYGPVMWVPFIVPNLLHADIRFVTLLGELFVPGACVLAAAAAASHLRPSAALAWLIVLTAIVMSSDLRGFASIGHTPAYWPIIAAFAWLVARQRWGAAAFALGLLIVARTTMMSIAPVLVMAVWHRDRRAVVPALVVMTLAVLLPFLPFAVWDWPALKYALYGSYTTLMKGFVWTSTDWVQHTIGVTGLLLRAGWQQATELAQAVALLLVYVMTWRALGRRHQPLPWMSAALLAFSMTTLWPVSYIYLDVFLLLVCAALADASWLQSRSLLAAWSTSLGVVGIALVLTVWLDVPGEMTIDIGTANARQALYSGFADDEHGSDRSFAWVEGTHAEVIVPRRSRSDADVVFVCQPNLTGTAVQEMSVVLNGSLLGTRRLGEGWQAVSMLAPAKAWQLGLNELTLSFSHAMSPRAAGMSDDPRMLSVAFDRLSIRRR